MIPHEKEKRRHPRFKVNCPVSFICYNKLRIGETTDLSRGGMKIQSHSMICSLVTIGNNCFIGHGVMFTNDKFSTGSPAGGNEKLWEKTYIGNNVSIGSNSTLLPVSICDNVVIGAGSVVTKDIKEPGIYAGNPARYLKPLPKKK